MFVSEIYQSFQGEGPWAGTPSLFVRTSGCNLRCWFCDTPYTSWQPEGFRLTPEQILDRVRNSQAPDVVLTGGEPMLSDELGRLTAGIRAAGRRITIETSGTVQQPVTCDLMAVSPKLTNSIPLDAVWSSRHDRTRHRASVVRSLIRDYRVILKFVIDRPDDVTEVLDYLQEFPDVTTDQVWLMPQARSQDQLAEKADWLRRLAATHGFHYSPRLHIEQFGSRRGV